MPGAQAINMESLPGFRPTGIVLAYSRQILSKHAMTQNNVQTVPDTLTPTKSEYPHYITQMSQLCTAQ